MKGGAAGIACRSCLVLQGNNLISLLLTLTRPTLPPPEHYKGRCLPDIDLLRWAENSLLQRVFTLHRMKCGEGELVLGKAKNLRFLS